MRKQWKFHAMAILIICGVISLVFAYMQTQQPKAVPAAPGSDRAIEMVSATWGNNCREMIAKENERRLRLRLRPQDLEQLHPDDRPKSTDPMTQVTPDNVLPTLRELCDGKLTCEFIANAMVLKNEPHEACFKHLNLQYRCFAFDRLWRINVGQSDTVTIDCHEAEPVAARP